MTEESLDSYGNDIQLIEDSDSETFVEKKSKEPQSNDTNESVKRKFPHGPSHDGHSNNKRKSSSKSNRTFAPKRRPLTVKPFADSIFSSSDEEPSSGPDLSANTDYNQFVLSQDLYGFRNGDVDSKTSSKSVSKSVSGSESKSESDSGSEPELELEPESIPAITTSKVSNSSTPSEPTPDLFIPQPEPIELLSDESSSNSSSSNSPDPEFAVITNLKGAQKLSELSPEAQIENDKKRRYDAYLVNCYLKEFGATEFIKKYLPKTANTKDINALINKMGYSATIPPSMDDGDRLMSLVNVLKWTIKKVLKQRTRLTDFYSIEHVLQKLQSANKILVITGAGISTSLGIPDFRSSQGFYSKLESLGLSDPQEVFDLDFFHTDPSIFYSIANLILPPENCYSPLHSFIKLLDDKNKLLRNYTQNIDNLEANVGISPERIIQCHGSFATASCVTCKYQVDGSYLRPAIEDKSISFCPKCIKARRKLEKKDDYFPESYGVLKPDMTFFGEKLPDRFHDNINEDLLECDLLISIGTSLEVAPVADIIRKIPGHIPQVLINKDPISHTSFDVSFLGKCDNTATYLCDRLNWNLDHPFYKNYNKENLDVRCLNLYEGLYAVVDKIESSSSKQSN